MTVRRPHTKFTGLSAEQVAERLGVKKETVYAYVSRGLLTRDRPPGSRVSRFDPDEVDRLAARHRHGGRAGAMEVVVDSKLTYLDPAGHFYYRGWDAVQASETASFEQVAAWLWGMHGAPDPKHETLFWPDGLLVSYAVAAARALPAEATPVDRYLAALAAAAAADPYRPNRDAYAVSVRGARLITALVCSLPLADDDRGAEGSTAARLWGRLSAEEPTVEGLAALDAALVLLADHELASSTLAARVAASTWADIYRVVMAGLAALGGPLHGRVGDGVLTFLKETAEVGPERAVGERLRSGSEIPGTGHLVYTRSDPRADALLARVRTAYPTHPILEAADQVLRAARGENPRSFPNVDLALAALVGSAAMVTGAAEAIFATARMAGFIAHGIEEYEHRLRFRIRAAYAGPEPGSVTPIRTSTPGEPWIRRGSGDASEGSPGRQ